MRIVIGGNDELAFRLAESLMTDHELSLVCPESARGPRLDRLDVDVVYGSPTATATLRGAGVDEADLFVAALGDDEGNLVACVGAKHVGVGRTTCFLHNLDFHSPEEERKVLAERLGIDQVIVPAEQLAEEILRIVVVPGALDVEVFLGGRVHLLRHGIPNGSPITRGPLMHMPLPENVVLVMGRRDDEMFIPKGNTEFQPGDKVTAMGSKGGIENLLGSLLAQDGRNASRKRATIVGGGSVGLAVALGLERRGWSVKIVETSRRRCEEIASMVDGLVLHGDGTDLDLLESERVGDDPVLLAVTSNDEKNLLVSLLAKHLGVPRIVTRVDQQSNERLFEKVGIDVVLSARGAAIQSVLDSVGHSKSDLLAELEHGDAEVLELEVPGEVEPRTISALKWDVFAIIGAIIREGRVIFPRGDDEVRGGDRLLVFCKLEHEHVVRDLFLNRLKRS
jgi:trk system potassium uptake protein TrkA